MNIEHLNADLCSATANIEGETALRVRRFPRRPKGSEGRKETPQVAPKHTEQDQRQSEAAPEGLAEPAGRQDAEGWGGYWKAQAPRPSAGRPQGCRATSGETGPISFEL